MAETDNRRNGQLTWLRASNSGRISKSGVHAVLWRLCFWCPIRTFGAYLRGSPNWVAARASAPLKGSSSYISKTAPKSCLGVVTPEVGSRSSDRLSRNDLSLSAIGRWSSRGHALPPTLGHKSSSPLLDLASRGQRSAGIRIESALSTYPMSQDFVWRLKVNKHRSSGLCAITPPGYI